jgi:glycosyltransferase involved in cell wall biosynthesis
MGNLVSADKIGLAVEPGNPATLAEAIINVLCNTSKFISCCNHEIESKYNWKNIAEITINCYKMALGNKASG